MNKHPEVSVIIPVYNGEHSLTECLRSVLDQSYLDYEVIVVDNSSTDKTKQIILEFVKKDVRIKYVYEPFRSRGAARTKGIKESRGHIILMTDSDCIVPGNWVEKIIEPIIEKNEYIVIGNEDDLVGNYWTRMQQMSNQDYLRQNIYKENCINHIDTKNFAIQKECFDSVGFFDKDIGNFEDFEFKIRLRKAGYDIYFLEDLEVKHRHSNNLYQLFLKRMDQGFWVTKIYFLHKDFFKSNPEEMIKPMRFLNFIVFFPWIVLFAFKNDLNKTFYEFICAVAWRIGIAKALVRR